MTDMTAGIGIKVLGDVQGNANYSITLDGVQEHPNPSNGALANFQNLTDDVHTLLISTVIPAVGGNHPVFFFDKAVIHFSTSSRSPLNLATLNDTFFQGSWGLKNMNNATFHQSQTKGDVVKLTFTGASFFLNGLTSPTSGTYSVTVDNDTSTLSGKSTFTNPDTLLFYVTGLDPTVSHKVKITNEEDHDLLLRLDGFQAFEPSAQQTSSPLESGAAIAKGTTAALVLAGVLGFLIISGLLYFFLVIRPQRRRELLARMVRRKKKEKEAGPLGVLNIAPTIFPDETEIGSREGTIGHHKKHSSEKSGFARWKREVEGGFENILGITFRHSRSTGKKSRKSGTTGGLSSAKSSVFTLSSLFTLSSSRRSHRKGKKKAKSKQASESSCQSTDIAVDIALRPDSPDSLKEKDAELTRLSPESHVYESDMHTLSYMNTPSVRPASASGPPILSHSRSGTDITSRATRQPVPRSSSRGHSLHNSESSGQQGSVGFLLNYDDPKTDSQEDVGDSVASMPPPFNPGHLSALAPQERGSARYSSDDATSYYLGSAATRLAIRSLRPRTAQSPDIQSLERIEQKARTSDKTHEPDDAQTTRGPPSPPNSDTSFLHVGTPLIRPIDIPPAEFPQIVPPAGIPELPHKVFLDISPSSTFRVDFPSNSSRASSHSVLPVMTTPPEGISEQNTGAPRLTTPSDQILSGNERNSFLDFGTSHSMPHQHQSPPSENLTQKQGNEGSRWSPTSQTANLSRSGSSNVSARVAFPTSGPTSYFPYPVSLTPSPYHPEGHLPAPPSQSRSTVLHDGAQQVDRRLAQLRLSAFGPPTDLDSVPTSVTSEKRLRHSGSTSDFGGGANSSQLLPHPPLPHKQSNASIPP
ncbi:hypothetical protein C0993_002563 [Termitomyces sp. T159_Od127]|nr:hypothetical protein C0993_002563 [Termitomyces sp. T159_Od127]